jgi:hypothetical protein
MKKHCVVCSLYTFFNGRIWGMSLQRWWVNWMTKFLRFRLDLCRIDCPSGTSKQSDIFNAL